MREWDELRSVAQQWPIPEGDLEHVQSRAKRLTLRRRVAGAGLASAALLAVAGALMLWPSPIEDRMPAVAAGSTPQGARAATFAFHALLDVTGYRDPEQGSFDYQGIEQTGQQEWVTTFLGGADPVHLAQALDARFQLLRDTAGNDDTGADIREEIRELKRDIRKLEAQLAAAREAGERHIRVTVRQAGDEFRVDEVEGPLEDDERDLLLDYTSRVSDISSAGYDFYRVRTRRRGSGFSVTAATFWTAPIPSPLRLQCGAVLIDGEGNELASDERSGFPHQAPPEEERRDGSIFGSEVDVPKRYEDEPGLDVAMRCDALDVRGWVTEGDARIEPATRKMVDGSGNPLDPDIHIIVVAEVDYKGDPGVESICIARVFDEQGQEISSHGQTLYPPNGRASQQTEVEIPVDVGDPDTADYATVHCQPTVPGVLLGPDQED